MDRAALQIVLDPHDLNKSAFADPNSPRAAEAATENASQPPANQRSIVRQAEFSRSRAILLE